MRRPLATILATLAFISACSSDPVDHYLSRVADITTTMRADSIAALPNPSAPTPDAVAGVTAARQQAATDLKQLTPPNDIRPEHEALLLAMSDLAAAGVEFLGTAEGLEDEAFVAAIRAATDIDDTAQRVATACDAMQRRAIGLGYTATIRC